MLPTSGQLSIRSRRPGTKPGYAVLYLAMALTCLMAFASLAVDYARVQCSKTQLQSATDAIARYAASGISGGTSYSNASAVAGYNTVNGSAVTVTGSQVVTGNWSSSNSFTAGGSPTNCVRVKTSATIPVVFALGIKSCNISATSYATYTSGQAYGIVGINDVYLQNGNISTDSWNSSQGAYSSSTAQNEGGVASNGNLTHNGNVSISSGLYLQSSSSVSGNGNFSYGSRTTLASPLSYSVASAGSASTTNNNASLGSYNQSGNFNMSSGTLNVPAGVYYLNSFSMSGGTLNINGAATFYINGNFTIQGGTVNVTGNVPSNFTVNVIASAGGNLTSLSSLYIDLYCPTSPINVNNCTNLYGSFIGSTFNVSNSCGIHVDQALVSGSGGGSGAIATVQ